MQMRLWEKILSQCVMVETAIYFTTTELVIILCLAKTDPSLHFFSSHICSQISHKMSKCFKIDGPI